MTNWISKYTLLCTGLGFCVGLIMAALMVVDKLRNWISDQRLEDAYGIINLPSELIARVLIWPGMGDRAFAMIPVAVFLQWVLVGFFTGLFLEFKKKKGVTH